MDIQRQAFEKAFKEQLGATHYQFDCDENGDYEDRETLCGWLMWQQAKKVAVPDRHLVVNKGDYVELVKTNRERQETIARLTEEIKIIRERKKFYKSKCKESLIPEGYVVVPREMTNKQLSISYDFDECYTHQERKDVYKAMIEAVEKNDE